MQHRRGLGRRAIRVGAAALRQSRRRSGPAGHRRGRLCIWRPGLRRTGGTGVWRPPGKRGHANALGSRGGQRGLRLSTRTYSQTHARQSSKTSKSPRQTTPVITANGDDDSDAHLHQQISAPARAPRAGGPAGQPTRPRVPDVLTSLLAVRSAISTERTPGGAAAQEGRVQGLPQSFEAFLRRSTRTNRARALMPHSPGAERNLPARDRR